MTGAAKEQARLAGKRDAAHVAASLATLVALARSAGEESLAESVQACLTGEAPDLAAALGFERRQGQHSFHVVASRERRNQLIRDAATRFFPQLSISDQAEAIRRELRRFGGSSWQRERTLSRCPARHAGTIREFLWKILKARDALLSHRQIMRILDKR